VVSRGGILLRQVAGISQRSELLSLVGSPHRASMESDRAHVRPSCVLVLRSLRTLILFPVTGAAIGGPGGLSPHIWAGGSRFLSTDLTRTLQLGSGRPSLIISGEPQPGLSRLLPGAHSLAVPGADADADAGDRNYLVLAKPNVIMFCSD
jgi:hypothetical protein